MLFATSDKDTIHTIKDWDVDFIVNPENICIPPVGAVSNRTEFGVKVITEFTIRYTIDFDCGG